MIYKIIVDKQPSINPSADKREYTVDIEELRVKGDTYDSLVITKDESYVIRRLSLSEYQVLSVLPEEVKEQLTDLNIILFEGDNYIYLLDITGNKFYAEYLVKNDFNDIYCTKNEMNSAIVQTASQIELSVNQKLTGYSTTKEMNSAITQKANEITTTVSGIYETKDNATKKYTEIKQTTDSITSTVSKKVGNDEVISKINQSAESVGIDATKIELSATDILNLLAGNTINLTSKNIVISSDKFSVDKKGKVSCSDISITGGKINLTGGDSSTDLLRIVNSENSSELSYIQPVGAGFVGSGGRVDICAECDAFGFSSVDVSDSDGTSTVRGSGIITRGLTQTSKESVKKNIVKYDENATEIIKNSEIYTYNFKSEKDEDKKHIGFVIADAGGEYKTPNQVISANKEGIDTYSMGSIVWKCVQELIERIEKLEGGQVNG